MADNRKDFRPRRLAFGGRLFPRACSLAAVFAICVAVGPASAEDAGLKNGAASLSAGKYDAAVRQLSSTINSDNTAPADAAKALYLRGLAYRKMGESARAIADLGAAIWLGLPEPDKVKAFVNRGLAYKSAGLSREGDAEFAAARKVGGSAADTLIAEGGGVGEGAAAVAAFSTEVRPAAGGGEQLPVGNQAAAPPTRTADASPTAWSTSVSDGQQPSSASSGNRLTRWFGSVTGSSSSPSAASRTRPSATGCASAAQTGGATAPPPRRVRTGPRRPRRNRLRRTQAAAKAAAVGRACSTAAPRPNLRRSRRRRSRAAASRCNSPPAAPKRKRRRFGRRSRRTSAALNRKSRRSRSAISAPSGASASGPSRTRRKALKSATP